MMKKTSLAAAVLFLAACAQSPDKIAAVQLPADTYANVSCSRAATLKHTAEVNLESLSIRQKKAARSDAIGVALLGVPTGSLAGGDKSSEIANLKGQINALNVRLSRC